MKVLELPDDLAERIDAVHIEPNDLLQAVRAFVEEAESADVSLHTYIGSLNSQTQTASPQSIDTHSVTKLGFATALDEKAQRIRGSETSA